MYDACMTRSTQVDIGGWIKMGHAACVIFKTRRRINQKLAVSHVLQINAPLPLSIWRNTHSLFANLFIFSRTPPLNIAAPSFRGFHLRNSNTFPWLKNLARSFFFFSFPENILHCNYRRWTRFLLNIFHASKRHLKSSFDHISLETISSLFAIGPFERDSKQKFDSITKRFHRIFHTTFPIDSFCNQDNVKLDREIHWFFSVQSSIQLGKNWK